MSQPLQATAIPAAISEKLRDVRQRRWRVEAASAAVAAAAVLLAAMGLAMLIDWLATLYDSGWRVVLTGAALIATALTGIGWLAFALRSLRWERVAADVDRQMPELEERWLTVADVGRIEPDPRVAHPAMYRRVAREALRAVPRVQPDQVVDLSPVLRSLLVLSAVTAVLALAAVFDWRQTSVLMRRFWSPRSLASATELVDVTDNAVVGRGEPFGLAANIEGTLVDKATLFLRPTGGAEEALTLMARGESPIGFAHRVAAVEQPFQFRFRAGDGQTEWRQVDVADRPEIKALQLTITPPAYTKQPAKGFTELPRQASALEGSTMELAILCDTPLKRLELRLSGDRSIELLPDATGWYRWTTTLEENFALSPVLTEPRGLANRRVPKCEFTVYKDQPPVVKVLTPDDETAVRPDDAIEITFAASDDVGIGGAELLVYDENAMGEEPLPIATIPIELGPQQGAGSIQATVALNLKQFAAEDGAALSYEIRVREDRGAAASNSQNAQAKAAAQGEPSPAPTTVSKASVATDKSAETAVPSPAAETAASNLPAPAGSPSQAESPTVEPTKPSVATSLAESLANNTIKSGDMPTSIPTPATEDAPAASSSGESKAADSKLADAPPMDAAAASADSAPAKTSTASAKKATASPQSTTSPLADKPSTAGATPTPATSSADSEEKEKPEARTASSGRKGVSSKQPADMDKSDAKPNKSDAQAADSTADDAQAADNPSENGETPAENQATPAERAQSAAKESNKPPAAGSPSRKGQPTPPAQPSEKDEPESAPTEGTPPPPNSMSMRPLDAPQSSSSKRMRLKVDEWAGSFSGQQQAKLAMAIAPELAALDKALAKAESTARGVLEAVQAGATWRETHDRDVTSAEQSTIAGEEIISKLQKRSANTPYAFVGLQVADIGSAHLAPARQEFWKTLQSEAADRVTALGDAAQHLRRARDLLAELRGQFERTKREFELAAKVERVKKMYQVYLENSQALLETQAGDPKRYNRDMVEFELDDDYLKRLKEVLEMRRDLRAELARILAEDPRLLRRFMDALRYRTNNLREELAALAADQETLNREVRAWVNVDEASRPRMAQILLLRQVQDVEKAAKAAGEMQDRYQTWLSLDREAKDPELAAASKLVQQVATAASELRASAGDFMVASQRAMAVQTPASPPAIGNVGAIAPTAAEAPTPPSFNKMRADGQTLYEQLTKLEVALRQLAASDEGAETAAFAANRLIETRRLIADVSAWIRQVAGHEAGNYIAAAEVDQYRLAMRTDEFAGKLGSIEQSLAALLQRDDGTLPEPIAAKAREFLAMLDKQAAPNQLAAVYSLHSKQLPRAAERQQAAGEALAAAEKLYDEMVRLAIEELDKLPVQDPIADLLDDPTLDELLAQLEQEVPLEELLGIPQRPSNLQIIGDWLRPGGDNSITTGGGGQMASAQIKQDEQRAQKRLDRAYQRAVARALKEATPQPPVEPPKSRKLSNWNKLVSRLGDDLEQGRDRAPPEEYRRAIEQYFAAIARIAAENEEKKP